MEEVIRLCLEIDTTARKIYEHLARQSSLPGLPEFWTGMAAEEASHVAYWARLHEMAQRDLIPVIFDDPEAEAQGLRETRRKVADLVRESATEASPTRAFHIALRLEFYLLHPTLETLFHYLKTFTLEATPEDEYEQHIQGFLVALRDFGASTPDLELLGEVVQRLWTQQRAATVQSVQDPLTGVLNRRGLFNAVHPLAHFAHRSGKPVAVLLVDLDRFKALNDTQGHAAGDQALKSVGRALKGAVRASDVVGRYGGDEFLVFATGVGRENLAEFAQKVREAISNRLGATEPPVTASVGMATATFSGAVDAELKELIAAADARLYEAKARGGDRACS